MKPERFGKYLLVEFIILIFLISSKSACSANSQEIYFDHYSYNYLTNEISFNNYRVKDFYEIYFSKNKRNVIYSKVNKGDDPELFLISGNTTKQISNNEFIEFNPVVNDNGQHAYALSEYSVSISKIYLNNVLLIETDDNLLYKNLEMNNKYLVFAREGWMTDYNYSHYLCIYDLSSHSYENIPVDGYIQDMKFIKDDVVLIQLYRPATLSMDIYSYNIASKSLTAILASTDDEIINKITDSYYIIDTISGDRNAKLMFNAYYSYYRCQLANPFASSNNFMSRLSFDQAYRLEFLIKLYELTGDNNIKVQINQNVENLLSVNNGHLGVTGTYTADFLWATKKYSLDHTTPISEIIDEARVFYPVLLAANKNLVGNSEIKEQILRNAIMMFDYFEKDYNAKEKLYHLPKGMPVWYDGVWGPYNYQSCVGLCALELYKATKDDKYRLRAFELAGRFKSEWVYTEDNRILWHYWPQEYYQGWTAADNLSDNTPQRNPSQDNYFDDTGHAAYNLKFVLEFQAEFPGQVFSDNDFVLLRNTIHAFIKADNSFSRYLSGLHSYLPDDSSWMPTYYWAVLKNDRLNNFYLNLIPKFYPDFEQENRNLAYLQTMENILDNDTLKVTSNEINMTTGTTRQYVKYYQIKDVRHYFIKKPSGGIASIINFLLGD